MHEYFDSFLNEQFHKNDLLFSIMDFAEILMPKKILMVHYSGAEDVKFHSEKQLSDIELTNWANKIAREKNIFSEFLAPKVGDVFELV